nr:hypothetical protein [Micromonospora siamensis]
MGDLSALPADERNMIRHIFGPALVTELLGTSPRFAALRAQHEVGERRPTVKRVDHPELGPLEFGCRVLHVPETDQRLIVHVAAPGSPTRQVFRRVGERVDT